MLVVAITYEDIYELLRTEKYSTDLQPLKQQDLIKIKEYFELKEEMLKKLKSPSIFSDRSKKDKVLTEIENAWRALRDLYEKREKKIINRALFSSRTKLKDSTNMLASEEKLYTVLIDLLRKNNIEFFENFGIKVKFESETKTAEEAEKSAESDEAKTLKDEKSQAVKIAEEHNLAASGDTEKIIEPAQLKKIIRFIEPVSELIDTNLLTYGPFEKEDIASLPKELADLLIKQNKAKEIISNEDS